MFCPFGEGPWCISWVVLVLMVVVISILLWLGIRAWIHSQSDQSGIGFHPSGRPYEPEKEEDEENDGEDEDPGNDDSESDSSPRTLTVGQKIPYFSDPLSPEYVVEEIERKGQHVFGRIEVPLPAGCEAINVIQKEEGAIEVVYKTPEGDVVSDESNLSGDPEELDGWNVHWSLVRTRKTSQ